MSIQSSPRLVRKIMPIEMLYVHIDITLDSTILEFTSSKFKKSLVF